MFIRFLLQSGGAAMNLSVQIGKLKLQNPVMVASGTFGYGVEYAQLLDLNQLGAVVVKGIRLHPVRGNPTPRTAEVTSGMLMPSVCKGRRGWVIKKYWPFLKKLKVPTIINIWARPLTNMPKSPEGLMRWWCRRAGTQRLLPEHQGRRSAVRDGRETARAGGDRVRKVTNLPLITKMSPNVVSIAPYARRRRKPAAMRWRSRTVTRPWPLTSRRASPSWRT